jgi:cytoskeleton protein RodZ
VSLFRRTKRPFNETVEEAAPEPQWPVHSVGRMLRGRREELGIDLETAGAALRIKPIYLAALEQNRAQDLPGPTYAVGFIRAYAHYLGFDGPRVLERYKAESAAAVQLRPDLSFPVPLGERSLPGGPILLVAAIIALCGYGTWYYLSTGARFRPERVAAVPAALEHPSPRRLTLPRSPAGPPGGVAKPAAPSPAVGKTADGAPASLSPGGAVQPAVASGAGETPASPVSAATDRRDDGTTTAISGVPIAAVPPPASAAPLPVMPANAAVPSAATSDGAATSAARIDIHAIADCWIQVRDASQSVLFARVLKAGETYRVPSPGLVMRVGNAGALAIDVGGKAAPPLGPAGALRRDVVLDPQALLAGTAVHG